MARLKDECNQVNSIGRVCHLLNGATSAFSSPKNVTKCHKGSGGHFRRRICQCWSVRLFLSEWQVDAEIEYFFSTTHGACTCHCGCFRKSRPWGRCILHFAFFFVPFASHFITHVIGWHSIECFQLVGRVHHTASVLSQCCDMLTRSLSIRPISQTEELFTPK